MNQNYSTIISDELCRTKLAVAQSRMTELKKRLNGFWRDKI